MKIYILIVTANITNSIYSFDLSVLEMFFNKSYRLTEKNIEIERYFQSLGDRSHLSEEQKKFAMDSYKENIKMSFDVQEIKAKRAIDISCRKKARLLFSATPAISAPILQGSGSESDSESDTEDIITASFPKK